MSNELKQSEFKLEKNIGSQKHAGRNRKYVIVDQRKSRWFLSHCIEKYVSINYLPDNKFDSKPHYYKNF